VENPGEPESPAQPKPAPPGFMRLSTVAGGLAPEPDEHHRDLWVMAPGQAAGHRQPITPPSVEQPLPAGQNRP